MDRVRKSLRQALLAGGVFHSLNDLRRSRKFSRESRVAVAEWNRNGRPAPPPDCIKHDCIRYYARKFAASILVETGTWKGDTIFALRNDFREIHSIELATELHAEAKKTLAHWSHIHLYHGDSATELPRVAQRLVASTVFWLDGHWCSANSARGEKDSPILEELLFLLHRHPGQNVVLIDDARLFVGLDGYPTLTELRRLVVAHRPAASFEVREDIIRIVPI